MSLSERIKQLETPHLRLVKHPEGHRDSIHRVGGRLLPRVIVSRGGAWTGEGKV